MQSDIKVINYATSASGIGHEHHQSYKVVDKYTLDTDCIIDPEEYRTSATHIQRIVSAHRNKNINLAIVAINTSVSQ